MAQTAAKNKKKILTPIIAIVCIIAVILSIGLKKLHDFKTPVNYQIQTISFTDFAYNRELKLIAHRGFRASAPENTIPAYENAGIAGYWGAECDIYRTTDGVWVLSHDSNIYRMMDGVKNIEKMSYEELMQHTIDNGNHIDDYPDLKIATLEEYLAVCEEYGMNATIELKGENNIEHYDEIIAEVKKHKAEVTYISFGEENLKAIKALDTEAPLFYLVHEIDDKAIETAKALGNCGISFNANKEKNLKKDGAAIKKVIDAGLTPAAWTVDDLVLMGTLIDYGVLYITTNCITY